VKEAIIKAIAAELQLAFPHGAPITTGGGIDWVAIITAVLAAFGL